ncbi:unnamed protein product [Lampetra fluviatilis]
MHLYLPPLLLLLTCARHSQARHEATKVTCSEQQEVTLQCPLPPGSEPAATHSQPVVWFIGSGLNGSCAHPDYVESFMKGGHHRQALFDIKHHHFIPDNHRTSLGRSDDGSSLTLSVRNLRASDSGHYCCAKRVHHHGHPEVPHAGTKETHNGTKKPRVRDANAGSSPRQDGAHPYNVLSVTELLVTQADTRDVVIVILISLVIISVIVIVITCFRAQKRRGRVIATTTGPFLPPGAVSRNTSLPSSTLKSDASDPHAQVFFHGRLKCPTLPPRIGPLRGLPVELLASAFAGATTPTCR